MSALRKWLDEERGRLVRLAKQEKVTPGAVWQWADEQVPAERIFSIEKATGIPVKRLRPDLFGKGAAA